MRKLILRGLVALVIVVAGLAALNHERLGRLYAVLHLFDEDRIVGNFSHMEDAFLSTSLILPEDPAPLPSGAAMPLPPGVAERMAARSVTGLVVLKDGQVIHEDYRLGTVPDDRRISWSVAKSFLSALTGILIAEGALPGVDVAVTDYAPMLKGSAYDGVRLRDVLTMSSGVAFNEDYLDFNSDINRMGRVLALGGSMDGFAAGLTEREAEPGARWKYVSIDTHVVGMVLRGATGRSVPDLMAEKLMGPLGIAPGGSYITDGKGVAFVLGGLNLTTRDYARFGQLIAQNGLWEGRQILPADWIEISTTAQAPGGAGYGFQWWLPEGTRPGEVVAQGIYGQFILIDRAQNIVVAMNSADRGFKESGVYEGNIAMLRAIRDAAAQE